MAMTDPIGDMLTRIRNAQERGKTKVSRPLRGSASVFSRCCSRKASSAASPPWRTRVAKPEIEIELKYFDGAPVIREIQRVSKPGRRIYASVGTMPTVYNGLGISILSTPKGVMSDAEARAQNVGGEVLCTVF